MISINVTNGTMLESCLFRQKSIYVDNFNSGSELEYQKSEKLFISIYLHMYLIQEFFKLRCNLIHWYTAQLQLLNILKN